MRTGAAPLEDVLAHGGWLVDSAQARHAANPDTFLLPSPETLAKIEPGVQVRAIFMVADQADPVIDGVDPWNAEGKPNLVVGHERMWLWVEQIDGDHVVGLMANQPIATHTRLCPGARVRVALADIIDVALRPPVDMADEIEAMVELGFPIVDEHLVTSPEDADRPPTIDPRSQEVLNRFGARAERPYPAPFNRLMLGRTVADGIWPIYGGRALPKPERGDCGWTIWATHPDMHEASERDGFDIVTVPEVAERHRSVLPLLALPPGWGFVLGENGYLDVFQDPELLS